MQILYVQKTIDLTYSDPQDDSQKGFEGIELVTSFCFLFFRSDFVFLLSIR